MKNMHTLKENSVNIIKVYIIKCICIRICKSIKKSFVEEYRNIVTVRQLPYLSQIYGMKKGCHDHIIIPYKLCVKILIKPTVSLVVFAHMT